MTGLPVGTRLGATHGRKAREGVGAPRVVCWGGKWLVAAAGNPLSSHPDRASAEAALDRLLAAEPPRPAPRERACLCCRAPFLSAGPGNRLCPACGRRSAGPVASVGGAGPARARRMGA